jgi:hypothetical protein|tara:strand:- start:153 stop:329 length:177 start_codon:yes stop_codon:yes gene_type:complete
MSIPGKEVYHLRTKTQHQGERGEIINKCEASSLAEAIITFAQIKQLHPDDLIRLFHVS